MLLVAHRTPITAAGCAALAAAGAAVFEVDVQLDRDRLVVSHFLPLPGTAGWMQHDNWRFRRRTVGDLDPSVGDIVSSVPADCLILLDPKASSPAARDRLTAAIIDQLPDRARYRVSTSSPADLARLRSAGFTTWRTIGDRRELAAVLAGGRLPDDAVSIRHRLLDAETLARLHERVGGVVAWTVNDVARARWLRDAGVDGVTTDHLDVLHALRG